MLLALTPPPDPAQALPADQFNENRIGLDHLSLGVAHDEIKPLEPFGIAALALRDPDNIQVELTASLA